MKKIVLALFLILNFSFIFAQTSDWDNLKVRIQKSDADIADAAKKAKLKTWDSRASLFLEVYNVNTSGLYLGLHQTGMNASFMPGADVVLGEPNSKKGNDDGTQTWTYDRLILYFDVDSLLENWKETQALDDKALEKGFEAIKEAQKLDTKGKYISKATTMTTTSKLRDAFMSKGIAEYTDNKLENALSNFDNSLLLYDYPRAKTDTMYSSGMINFYAGQFATGLYKTDVAKKYYEKALAFEYEPVACYSALYTIAAEQNNDAEKLRIVEAAYKDFPSSLDVINLLINYYSDKNDVEGALTYLNKAIKESPTNPTVFFVKGVLYDRLATDSLITNETKKQEYYDQCVSGYKKAIELNKDYFEAYFNLAVIYFNKAKVYNDQAQALPTKEKAKYEEAMTKSKEMFNEAKPYMEEAHRIDPSDETVMGTLVTIYLRLQMYDKQKEMKAKLEAAKNK